MYTKTNGLPGAATASRFGAVCLVLLFSSPVAAQWMVTDLHPAGATSSAGLAIRNGIQVGYANIPPYPPFPSTAARWTGSAASYVGLGNGIAYGTDGVEYVGITPGAVGGNAIAWSNGPPVDLAPPLPVPPDLAFWSQARGVHAGLQVGTNVNYIASLTSFEVRAGIWTGDGNSWTSLHPANDVPNNLFYSGSEGYGTHNGAQVGWVWMDYLTPSNDLRHAALWYNTPGSFVDLHPIGASDSVAYDIYNGVAVGSATYANGLPLATLWTTSPTVNLVDLHPMTGALPNTVSSEALAVYGGLQAGYVMIDGGRGTQERASLWAGTEASWVDLHAFLPSGYSDSRAEGVWISNAGDVYVVGWAINSSTGSSEAKLWGPIPEPSSSSLLMMMMAAAALWRQRRR